MAANKLQQLLSLPDKGITKTSGTGGVLSRLWRQMCYDLNITPLRSALLLQNYVMDPRNGVPNNRPAQISARGNLTKEFARPYMSWKVFCKALRFIGITKIEIQLKAYHYDGKVSEHATQVNFGNPEIISELMEQDSEAEYNPHVVVGSYVRNKLSELQPDTYVTIHPKEKEETKGIQNESPVSSEK